MKKAAFIAAISLLLFSFFGCTQKTEPVTSTLFVMTTDVSQKVYGSNADKAIEKVESYLKESEKRLSTYLAESEISKINENAGIEPVHVSDDTFRLIKKAKALSEASEGHFDLTVAPLSKLWNISGENPIVPSEDAIRQALALVDYRNVILDEASSTVYLTQTGMAIDLGGIAKGAFCSDIAKIYQEYEVESALISIGGNIFTYNLKPDKTPYKLGIRNPMSSNASSAMGVFETHDEVIATSGAYERYFEQNGVVYHHILDLSTGMPSQSDLLSVTVISEDGALADYLSTTLYLAGKEAIPSYIDRENFSVIVIDKEQNVYISPSIRDRFTITANEYTEVIG